MWLSCILTYPALQHTEGVYQSIIMISHLLKNAKLFDLIHAPLEIQKE